MPYSDAQLKGALLEEVILYLLYTSGYDPVFDSSTDPTLQSSSSGLKVRGRGEWHQIDAIADFSLTPPFSHPQRVLVEAKFYRSRVGIDVLRNATGVHKDVSEVWTKILLPSGKTATQRFHYLYAVFSATSFSEPAQNYAYAQGISLMPLRQSAYLSPIIDAIDSVTVGPGQSPPKLSEARQYVRERLFSHLLAANPSALPSRLQALLTNIVNSCLTLRYGFIAMLGNRMPIFLVAKPNLPLFDLPSVMYVRVRWRANSWFVEGANGEALFSFDLPDELVDTYASSNRLDRRTVANIKNDWMRQFYGYYRSETGVHTRTFILDDDWFQSIQQERGLE